MGLWGTLIVQDSPNNGNGDLGNCSKLAQPHDIELYGFSDSLVTGPKCHHLEKEK